MDMHDLAAVIAGSGQGARLRLRQGLVGAVAGDGTISVYVGGAYARPVTGVKCLASYCPRALGGVWLVSDGADLFAVGSITPEGPAYCSVERTNDGVLATGTWYELSFATSTRTDPYGMWAAGTPDRIICRTPGIYQLSAVVTFGTNATGRRDLLILVNGASIGGTMVPAASGTVTKLAASMPRALALGDYVQLSARQSSGGDLTVTAGAGNICLAAAWLRGPVAS